MNIEEASLYLKHTSKDDFNLEEYQNANRYEAIQVVLQEIERLNNIINELEKQLLEWHSYWEDEDTYNYEYKTAYDYLQELKGSDKE